MNFFSQTNQVKSSSLVGFYAVHALKNLFHLTCD